MWRRRMHRQETAEVWTAGAWIWSAPEATDGVEVVAVVQVTTEKIHGGTGIATCVDNAVHAKVGRGAEHTPNLRQREGLAEGCARRAITIRVGEDVGVRAVCVHLKVASHWVTEMISRTYMGWPHLF